MTESYTNHTMSIPRGSAAWLNDSQLENGGAVHTRVHHFLASIDWDRLCGVANTLRRTYCQMSDKYSVGSCNMVRELVFPDGERWVARLRLPKMEEVFGGRHALDPIRSMESEIATMKLLRYPKHLDFVSEHR